MQILNFTYCSLHSKYLGVPLSLLVILHYYWEALISKFHCILSSWNYKHLNLASKVTLLKSILQSLLIYHFSNLTAAKSILQKIRQIQRNFFWGRASLNKKWALVSSDTLCFPKQKGDLGVRDLTILCGVLNAKT